MLENCKAQENIKRATNQPYHHPRGNDFSCQTGTFGVNGYIFAMQLYKRNSFDVFLLAISEPSPVLNSCAPPHHMAVINGILFLILDPLKTKTHFFKKISFSQSLEDELSLAISGGFPRISYRESAIQLEYSISNNCGL